MVSQTGRTPALTKVLAKILDSADNPVDFPGLQGVNRAAFLGTPGAAAADGALVPLQVNGFGALRVILTTVSGREVKAHRFDIPHSATTTDFNDQYQANGNIEFRYDSRNSKLRRTDVIGANTRILSAAATNNATAISAVSITLGKVKASNERAGTPWYLKLYDKATAPVPASDVPFMVIKVKPTVDLDFDFGGYVTLNGLQMRTVINAVDTDDTAVAAGDFTCFNLTHS